MSKVIRIEDETFARLQGLAEPLVDTPSSVIKRLLDYYESSLSEKALEVTHSPSTTDLSTAREHRRFNLFLAPAVDENINKTIRSSVSLKKFEHMLSKEDLTCLQEKSPDPNMLHCWAMTEGSRASFEHMKEGDLVLFTIKNSGKFEYLGEVSCKVENEGLGNYLWDEAPNKPWTLIYFLKNVVSIDVDKPRLIAELGYQANYAVPGVTRVNMINLQIALNRYGTLDNLIDSISN